MTQPNATKKEGSSRTGPEHEHDTKRNEKPKNWKQRGRPQVHTYVLWDINLQVPLYT